MPWILQTQEKGCYSNLLANLIQSDIPGYQNFVRMPPAFFDIINHHHTPPHQDVSHQFQEATGSWTETGNNAETPGHWRDLHLLTVSLVGWLNHHKYLHCPDSPIEWKRVEEKFKTRWNVPHAVGAIDWKHIAMKKPKQSGSDFYTTYPRIL